MQRNLGIAALTTLAILASSATVLAKSPQTDKKTEAFALHHDQKCKVMKEQFIELTSLQAAEQWYWQQHYQHHRYGYYDEELSGDVVAESSASDAPAAAPRSSSTRAPAAKSTDSGAGSSASSGPENYTKTNNQEQGVDEADIVKTDGKYIYTLTGDEIVIVKSWPVSEARVISRLKLGTGTRPTMLFLNGDKLVAMSYVNNNFQLGKGEYRRNWYGATRVSVIDIRNRANPFVVRNLDFEGYTNQARMVGQDVYVVTNSGVTPPQKLWQLTQDFTGWPKNVGNDQNAAKREAYESIKKYLSKKLVDVDFEASLPHKRISGYRGKFGDRKFEPLVNCADIHVPRGGVQYGMLSLVHFNLTKPWQVNSSAVFGQGWNVYGSEEAIYVAMPNYSWAYWYRWYHQEEPDYDDYNSTTIHKFELRRDKGKPSYASSGRVRGYLHNQFSMSEYKGDLRVATTDMNWWWGGQRPQQENPGNHIYVMRPDGNHLATIGRVEGLAPGERIYAARMFGDKGYVVTFRQTDPLYTLDLSDPTQPEVAGELKINGFSSYIHPIGNGQLLTVGQDADDNGRVKGVHLQIFDVTDPSTPTRTHHHTFETMGYSWSAAQWDHKAFTYDPLTGTLALPMQFYPRGGTGEYFNGIYVFHVDADDGFSSRGRVSHNHLVERWRQKQCEQNKQQYYCQNQYQQNYWWGWANLNRSIIMDDTIFTLSNLGIMAHKIEDTDSALSTVELAKL